MIMNVAALALSRIGGCRTTLRSGFQDMDKEFTSFRVSDLQASFYDVQRTALLWEEAFWDESFVFLLVISLRLAGEGASCTDFLLV